jgi:hypothetical protein
MLFEARVGSCIGVGLRSISFHFISFRFIAFLFVSTDTAYDIHGIFAFHRSLFIGVGRYQIVRVSKIACRRRTFSTVDSWEIACLKTSPPSQHHAQ